MTYVPVYEELYEEDEDCHVYILRILKASSVLVALEREGRGMRIASKAHVNLLPDSVLLHLPV